MDISGNTENTDQSPEDAVFIGRIFSSRDWDFVIKMTAISTKIQVQEIIEKADRNPNVKKSDI